MNGPPVASSNSDNFSQPADPRSALFVAGVSPDGQVIRMSPVTLRHRVDAFPVTRSTPQGVASLLDTSRALLVQAYFKYEFFAVGASWSLMAVEAGLRQRLPRSRKPFHDLINLAGGQQILTDIQVEYLQFGRQIRNEFAHPAQQYVYTPTMALDVVDTSHRMIAELFPDEPARPTEPVRGTQ